MKPRTLLALALTLTAPVVHDLASPRLALAQDKDKSPAKQQIADANYDCNELSRLVGLSGWEGDKFKVGMVEDQAKTCDASVGKVKKADPKWDVSAWEKLIKDAQARVKKAREGGGAAAAKKDTGPNPDSSPARDDIALTKGAVSALEKKMADPTDLGGDPAKLDSFKIALGSVTSGMKRIKAADPKWDLSEWQKLVDAAEARLKKGQQAASAKESADKANETAYRNYVAKLSSVSDGMELLAQLEKKPGEMKIYSKNQIFGNMAAYIAKVEGLDKDCREKGYDKLTVIPSYYVKEIPAVEGCKRAAKWKELGKKFVELQTKGGVKEEVSRLQGVMDRMKKGDRITAADHQGLLHPDEHINYFKADYDKGGKAFGVVTDVAWYAPIKTAAAGYPAALADAAKTSRWEKTATIVDQGTSSAVIKQHQKGGVMDEGDVVKVAAFDGWDVETDVWKTPVKRSRNVEVLVKIKGETYCRLYSRRAGSSYSGGAWAPTGVGGGESEFQISACK